MLPVATLRSILGLNLAFIAHLVSFWYVHYVVSAADNVSEIVDTGFLVLPAVDRGLGEVIPYLLLLATFAVARDRSAVLGQCAALMVLRALCVAATVLPSSYAGCQYDALSAFHGGCRDKVFSGHAAYVTLMALHLGDGEPRALQACLAGAVAAEALYLVASREHYSVDVLVAVALAWLVFRAARGRAP